VSDMTDRSSPFPSADEIARLAHELFVGGGRRITLIPEYWRRAERELLDRAVRRATNASRTHRSRAWRPR